MGLKTFVHSYRILSVDSEDLPLIVNDSNETIPPTS